MAVIAKWTMPKSAAEWEQQEARKALRKMLRTYVKWFIVLGGAAAYIVYRFYRDEFGRVLAAISAAAALFPAHLASSVVRLAKTGRTYSISDGGLRERARGQLWRWDRIEAYRFSDHPGVPGIRCLEFKIRHHRKWRRWPFDTALMEEAVLRAILAEYLPGRCWDGMPMEVVRRA
jgi:hypothetical protein